MSGFKGLQIQDGDVGLGIEKDEQVGKWYLVATVGTSREMELALPNGVCAAQLAAILERLTGLEVD